MNRPSSALEFVEVAGYGMWTPADHLLVLLDHLDRLAKREIKKLMIFMPPRHAKSTTVDEMWLPYYLLEHPDHRVILASHTAEFARTWGRKARRIVEEFGPPMYGINVAPESSAANDWEIAGHRGGMLTAGIGGAITGRGANVLVIDDPVKDEQEAASQTIQQRNIDWYRTTANTRLEPGGVQILIMTRWHENDLAGMLLAEEGHEWTVLNLPALAEKNDAMGRPIGQALWRDRFDEDALANIQYGAVDPETGHRHGGIGSYFWSAMYQQSPTPEQGNVFKRDWWNYYDQAPAMVQRCLFVDTAGYDDKTTGDYAAISTVGRYGKDAYWLNAQRGHWEFPELTQRCIDEQDANDRCPIVIEETPWSKPLIQTLKIRAKGPVIAFRIEGRSKLTRAQAASPFAEAGHFYLPRNAQWASEFIDEHAAFPNGAHDDWVDTTSMMALRFFQPSIPQMGPATRNGHAQPPVRSAVVKVG